MQPELFNALAEGRLTVDVQVEATPEGTKASIDAYGVQVSAEHRDGFQAQNDVMEKFRKALADNQGVMERTF